MVPVVPLSPVAASLAIRRFGAHLLLTIALVVGLGIGVAPALAVSANDYPLTPPSNHLLEEANVVSRASSAEVENQLEALSA